MYHIIIGNHWFTPEKAFRCTPLSLFIYAWYFILRDPSGYTPIYLDCTPAIRLEVAYT